MAVVIDRNPTSENPLAKPHGRLSMCFGALDVVLVLVHSFYHAMNTVALAVLLLVVLLVELYFQLKYLPFYSEFMCQLTTVCLAIRAWGAICSVQAAARRLTDEGVEGYVFLLVLPCIVGTAFVLARERFRLFDGKLEGEVDAAKVAAAVLNNACVAELQQRRIIARAIERADIDGGLLALANASKGVEPVVMAAPKEETGQWMETCHPGAPVPGCPLGLPAQLETRPTPSA